MTSLIEEIDVDLVDLLVEFCLNEIALEGLQGKLKTIPSEKILTGLCF